MTATNWLPIRYRDFYDLPRIFTVEYRGMTYAFDCPFDPDADEYPDRYRVFRVQAEDLDGPSWLDLLRNAELVGQVGTRDVVFDKSRRQFIDDAVFGLVGLDTK